MSVIRKLITGMDAALRRENILAEWLAERERVVAGERGMGEQDYDETCTAVHWLDLAKKEDEKR